MGKRTKKFALLIADSIRDSCLIIVGAFAGAFLGAYFPKTGANLDWNVALWGTFFVVFALMFFVRWAYGEQKPSE